MGPLGVFFLFNVSNGEGLPNDTGRSRRIGSHWWFFIHRLRDFPNFVCLTEKV